MSECSFSGKLATRREALKVSRSGDVVDVTQGDSTVQIIVPGNKLNLLSLSSSNGSNQSSLAPWGSGKSKVIKTISSLGNLLLTIPDKKSRQALAALLLELRQHLPRSSAFRFETTGTILQTQTVRYPVAPERQVYAFPIGTDRLNENDLPIEFTSAVRERATGRFVKAKFTRYIDEDGGELYKVCVKGESGEYDHVVGFRVIDPFDSSSGYLHLPVMGNLDPRYTDVGNALRSLAVHRMLELDANGIVLQSSWSSARSHVNFFRECELYPAKYLSLEELEAAFAESAANGDERLNLEKYGLKEGELGSVLLHFPEETIESWNRNPDPSISLSLGQLNSREERTLLGTTMISDQNGEKIPVNIFLRRSAGLDIIDLYTQGENEHIGVASLNHYRQDPITHEVTDSQGYSAPAWSPNCRYVPNTFIEYDNEAPGERFDETEIRQKLFRIAFEISKHNGCGGRLKMEGDTEWGEEMGLYAVGMRPMFNGVEDPTVDPRVSQERLQEYILAAVQAGDDNALRAVGSFELRVTKEAAIRAYNRYARRAGEPEIVA